MLIYVMFSQVCICQAKSYRYFVINSCFTLLAYYDANVKVLYFVLSELMLPNAFMYSY